MNYVLIHAFVPSDNPQINFHYSEVEPYLELSKPMSYSDARLKLDRDVSLAISKKESLALLGNDSFHLIFHTNKVIAYFEESHAMEWWELKQVRYADSNIRYPKEILDDD